MMFNVFIQVYPLRRGRCIQVQPGDNVGCLMDKISSEIMWLDTLDVFIQANGSTVDKYKDLSPDVTYHVVPRLLGGKGGFGSMLRALGAQIEKTTNHEACRDLSGRRMRDVNNEKNLKEWISKKADMEREREEKRREKRARMLQQPMHKFDDPKYHEQRSKVTENLQDALSQGLSKASNQSGVSGSRKRKATDSTITSGGKKSTAWLGLDLDDEIDSDSDSSSSTSEKCIIPLETDVTQSTDITDVVSGQCDTDEASEMPGSSKDNNILDNEMQSNKTSKDDEHPIQSTVVKDESQKNEAETATKNDVESTDVNKDSDPIELEDFSSSSQLEELGLERLKNALMARGLKCGGTLQQRAERLFSIKGLTPDQIDKSLLAKPSKGKKK